jgi:glucosamine kinase
MFDFLIGVDGGGTGTRVRLAAGASEIGHGAGGPSGLINGSEQAWAAVETAVAQAFAMADAAMPPRGQIAIGLGLAGVHNKQWGPELPGHNPGYAAIVLETDAYTTLLGAHGGARRDRGDRHRQRRRGAAAGRHAPRSRRLGLPGRRRSQRRLDGPARGQPYRAVLDGRTGMRRRSRRRGRFLRRLARRAVQVWLAGATQTRFAQLAPLVLDHAATVARAILVSEAGFEAAKPSRSRSTARRRCPLALCGGLGERLRPYLPKDLLARTVPPAGDSATGGAPDAAMRANPNRMTEHL